MQATLLIVDDEKNTREGLRSSLEDDFDVYTAPDQAGAMEVLRNDKVDLLLADLRLGNEDGMELIEQALKQADPPVCIMMTAYGSVDTAVEAMKRGAYDFVTKPINIDKLEILIRRALKERRMEDENRQLRQQVERRFGMENLIGESPAIREVLETIRQVAPTRATVLIEGESGTGKELVAHAIHNLSNRHKARFVAVHCAALSAQLLESELFGHEKGAFTGASERRIGRFEQASGGTLFLDEIGEIDSATQVKILRVLGERTFERVGGNKTLQADVRLVAATNKDLATLVSEGKFRDDLFFRLNVVQIQMPPLRERKTDIPLLAHAFLKHFAEENAKQVGEISDEAMNRLLAYNWPGNVRELRTAIEHGVVMTNSDRIEVGALPPAVRRNDSQALGASAVSDPTSGFIEKNESLNLQETERQLILRALEDCGNNRTAAAKKLGISRRTLYRKLDKITPPQG